MIAATAQYHVTEKDNCDGAHDLFIHSAWSIQIGSLSKFMFFDNLTEHIVTFAVLVFINQALKRLAVLEDAASITNGPGSLAGEDQFEHVSVLLVKFVQILVAPVVVSTSHTTLRADC